MTFDDLKFDTHPTLTGVRAKVFFSNGYGASVIRGYGSYGFEEGLYELAVLAGSESSWGLCYTTPITDDVMGHLTEDKVTDLLQQIEALPSGIN